MPRFLRRPLSALTIASLFLFAATLSCRAFPHHIATFGNWEILWDRREIILAHTPQPAAPATFPLPNWGSPWPRIESQTLTRATTPDGAWMLGIRLWFAMAVTLLLPTTWVALRLR